MYLPLPAAPSARAAAPPPLRRTAHGRRSCWLELVLALTVAAVAAACEPDLVVGTWSCGGTGNPPNPTTEDAASATIPVPWSTSFEDGFCGYPAVNGFCYTNWTASSASGAAYQMVTSPVHSGHFAAAFTVDSSLHGQARCVRQGLLPDAAYYGAWYFIPSLQTNSENWNLLHFQGGSNPQDYLHNLWDISLVNDQSGNLELKVLNLVGKGGVGANAAPPVPIGSWFHIQIYLRRAADATGEVTVYQDGVVAYHLVNLMTDDSIFGQWYVGNLATALLPSESTIYVDDVEISDTL